MNSETQSERQNGERREGYSGKIKNSIKALYSIGYAAHGIKDGLFQAFLFIYFNQVLGLNAALAGTALIIALVFDAITDPLVGLISDNWKSTKWGRRHPFILASAFPLGVSTYFLFAPPVGFTEMQLFGWMTVFVILVRLSLTLLIIPHASLGAEMTTDYQERTSIMTFRIAVASLITPVILFIGFTSFFVSTDEYANGLDNQEAYPSFAFFCGILMIVFVLISALGTRSIIKTLPQNASTKRYTALQLLSNLKYALRMKSFIALISYAMIMHIGIGIGTTFTTYFMKYYFELSTTEMAILPLGTALGAIIAFIITPMMAKRYDKKNTAMISTFIFAFFFSLPFFARELGVFPENGTQTLLLVYFITIAVGYAFIWVALSLVASMMADVIDESETYSNTRQEGLFFSSMSFAYKCTLGIGTFGAGLLLTLIAFPKPPVVNGVAQTLFISDIPSEAIHGLGYVGGPILFLAYISATLFLRNYPITKERYKEIRTILDNK